MWRSTLEIYATQPPSVTEIVPKITVLMWEQKPNPVWFRAGAKAIHAVLTTGTPNNGFLLNTFKTLFRLSRVVLDLFRCYEIFIRPLILGELDWVFSKLQGLRSVFSLKKISCIFRFNESENFTDSSLHRIFGSENFRFPFSTTKTRKIKLLIRKS